MTIPSITNESSVDLKPNRRYRHGYAIVRVDDYFGPETPTERRVTVKKIVFDPDEAEREVDRLNNLQDADGSRYFLQITRIDDADQRMPAQETSPANRIHGFMSEGPTDKPDPETRAWLESICVPPYLSAPPPGAPNQPVGFGFPAYRAFEVCEAPSERHQIRWADMDATIFMKRYSDGADVVCVQRNESVNMFSFAYRVFDDLCEVPLSDLTPLAIVEKMAERFGLTMSIGGVSGRFFLKRDFELPTIIRPGMPEGQIIYVDHQGRGPGIIASTLRITPPHVRVALGFALDLSAYWNWVTNR